MMREGGVDLATGDSIHVCLQGPKDEPTGRILFKLAEPVHGVLLLTYYRPLLAPLAAHGDIPEGTVGVPCWEPWVPFFSRVSDRRLRLDHPMLAGVTAEALEEAAMGLAVTVR